MSRSRKKPGRWIEPKTCPYGARSIHYEYDWKGKGFEDQAAEREIKAQLNEVEEPAHQHCPDNPCPGIYPYCEDIE